MDQSQLLSIVGGMYDKLVGDVSDAVICKLKAEGSAQVSLEPDTLAYSFIALLRDNASARDAVRDIASDVVDNIVLSDMSDFQEMQRDVESIQEKIDTIEGAVVDADDSDFDSAVMQVLRNNI